MKNPTPEELGVSKKRSTEKKISTNETKKMAKMKFWVTWITAAAFIITSGIVIFGSASMIGGDKTSQEQQAQNDPQAQEKSRAEADIKFWSDKVRQEPGNAQNRYNLGDSYLKANQPEKAIESLKLALEMEPKATLYKKHLATAYALNKNNKKAEEIIKTALKEDPKDETLYQTAARIYYSDKKYDQAVDMLRKAVKINPGELNYYVFLGQTLSEAGKKKEALKAMDEGIEIAKNRNDEKTKTILETIKKSIENPQPKAIPGQQGKNVQVQPQAAPGQSGPPAAQQGVPVQQGVPANGAAAVPVQQGAPVNGAAVPAQPNGVKMPVPPVKAPTGVKTPVQAPPAGSAAVPSEKTAPAAKTQGK